MTSEIELVKSAVAGDRDSQYKLGKMYRDGEFGVVDVDKAIKWFTSASDSHIRAKYELAILLEKNEFEDKAKIISLMDAASRAGEKEAMLYLARAYRDGKYVQVDLETSVRLYRKCVNVGLKRAKLELAELLYKSKSEIDNLESVKYCYELALVGDKDAMFRLYLQYMYGVGTKKDVEWARMWLQKAADAGHNGAKSELERL